MFDFILRMFRPSAAIFVLAFLFLLPFLFYVTFNATTSIYWQKIDVISVLMDDNATNLQQKNETEKVTELGILPKLEISNELEWHQLLTNSSKILSTFEKTTEHFSNFENSITNQFVKKSETPPIQSSIRGLYNLTNFAVPTSSNVDFVIIVQIHDRVKYLNALIQSLSKVANIDRVLLVFSCDFNSDEIHNLIRGIKFCKTLRITFPFNIQRYEHEFPGQSPSDCSEDGKNINCTNFNSTDIKGQHRKANLAQIKHHWWWKLNYMFELVMPKFGLENKFLVLLEEDHIVAPDFLHTLRLIVENRKNFCSGCELICLGAYPNSFNNYAENANKLAVEVWFSSKNNMGMVIDEQLWRKIQNCSKLFCSWDDYNWDWTLLQLSIQCLPKKLEVIYTESPRVIHIGDCGVHWHKCENDHRSLDLALDLFKSANASFFPSKLEVLRTSKRMFGVPSAANGGWADPRDQRLCELNTHPLAVDDPRLVLIKARAVLDGEN